MTVRAVVLDLDGVIIDSEEVWEQARQRFAELQGKVWTHAMNTGIIGMGPRPSSEFIQAQLDLALGLAEIQNGVVDQLLALYEDALPISPGAIETVSMLAAEWPLGLASSASRRVMDRVLSLSGLEHYFRVTVSSEEVTRGKPFPDVYLEACNRLAVDPHAAVAIEDSNSGIESALSAGMAVVAVTGSAYPPSAANRRKAGACVHTLAGVSAAMVARASQRHVDNV